ncbi:Homocysteine S-methyltransferase [Umbelopsis sp. PMI_123]|nr:Homocysteine S-methyltransferase [Umbelopsis sp. PMI_123]
MTITILDGGMATTLERTFHKDLTAHTAHLEAGAEIITTCTYQASYEGFQRAGYSEKEAIELMRRGVELADEARKEYQEKSGKSIKVALSIGCYGAILANGAEYSGDYGDITLQSLVDFHRRRLDIFFDDGIPYCGIDFILFETVPSYLEARAIHYLLQETPYTIPSMVSFSCNSAHTVCHGEPIAQCVSLFNDLKHVTAVGVNCTKPKFIASLLQDIKDATQNKTLLLYPDGGEEWDAEARTWKEGTETDPHEFGTMCKSWVNQFGPDFIIGGCCGTTAHHISSIKQSLVDQ